uniref:ADP-ribosyl cyclase/cyclic ADP-ribose hydrolase n=1 Tax=Quercus lobata TaxID=97700 RepID=A0A7N2LC49_QUELO
MKAIEKSRIAVVVFSKNYGNSDWCLDELVKIMECKRLFNQRVIPIFYDVSPSEVRKQEGDFAEALRNGPEDKVNSWKVALTNVASLAGSHLNPYRVGEDLLSCTVVWFGVLCKQKRKEGRTWIAKRKRRERNPKETTSSCSFSPLCLATMASSTAPSLLVLAALLLSLGIALVLPQLVLCVATMTHTEGQENFDPSLSTPALTHEYQVFVSFRGADIRTGFKSHFFAALNHERIGAYRDDIDLPRGGEIGPELLKAIETSRIAVVVFSKNYATSDWCLDELVKIMECKRLLNQRVLPIFYDVSQSEVLEQMGNFAEALLKGPEDKVNNWRAALTEAAGLAGLHLEQYSAGRGFGFI